MVQRDALLAALEKLCPLQLAASWDNVGLLLDASDEPVERVLLTIDLNEAVMNEALEQRARLVVAYHPLIFGGLSRIDRTQPLGRIVHAGLRNGISVWCPHTALDAVSGGINDWLLEAFGAVREVLPIEADARVPGAGMGRMAVLAEPLSLDDAIARTKAHLGLAHVRVARGDRLIGRVAVCAGAGGGVFKPHLEGGKPWADLYLTGEMRHHDVLSMVARGASVIVCDHTNTERGYLPRLAQSLEAVGVVPILSRVDRDPLCVV